MTENEASLLRAMGKTIQLIEEVVMGGADGLRFTFTDGTRLLVQTSEWISEINFVEPEEKKEK